MLSAGRLRDIQWQAEAKPWCTIYFSRRSEESTEEVATAFDTFGWKLTEERPPAYLYMPTGLVFKKK
jgi:hypothetical protein